MTLPVYPDAPDAEGFYWVPTNYLKFVRGRLNQWWVGEKPTSYGEMAHPACGNIKGEWREVKSE